MVCLYHSWCRKKCRQSEIAFPKKIGTGLSVCLKRGTNVSIRHLYCCFEQFQSLLWCFTNSRGTMWQVRILGHANFFSNIVYVLWFKLDFYLCSRATSDVDVKWRPLWENRLACFSLKLSKSTVWFSRIRSPLYMGARAGQLDAGFEARLFSRAALFLCLYTPTFLIWVRVSQQSVVIFISLSGRQTDR